VQALAQIHGAVERLRLRGEGVVSTRPRGAQVHRQPAPAPLARHCLGSYGGRLPAAALLVLIQRDGCEGHREDQQRAHVGCACANGFWDGEEEEEYMCKVNTLNKCRLFGFGFSSKASKQASTTDVRDTDEKVY
jgi:hypothetical protein